MLIEKLRKNEYIEPNVKNPSDTDIIKGYDKYINREIERQQPKWA